MTQSDLDKRQAKAQTETLVISRTDDGFRVYNPAEPSKSYTVAGSPEQPTCSCPDFQYHDGQSDWRCKHILAVLERYANDSCAPALSSQAGQNGELAQAEKAGNGSHNGGPHMLIKRSVSPDGRIDSLSVEFSCPVEKIPPEEVRSRAEQILDLQSDVVESFLSRRTNGGHAEAAPPQHGNNGAVPAQMLSIGGMNGKWGRRLFINVQANGQTLKLFGNRKELAEAIAAAGFPNLSERIAEGILLNLPCRVTTRQNGQYLNVERVLPLPTPQSQRSNGWRQ